MAKARSDLERWRREGVFLASQEKKLQEIQQTQREILELESQRPVRRTLGPVPLRVTGREDATPKRTAANAQRRN